MKIMAPLCDVRPRRRVDGSHRELAQPRERVVVFGATLFDKETE